MNRETTEIERYRQVAQQQSISGPLIGLTGVTSSTLGTIAFYEYLTDRQKTNSLIFSGRVVQIVGQSYAVLNTPYTMAVGFMKNRRLAAKGELPSQILEQRLKNIDTFEKKIKEEKFP